MEVNAGYLDQILVFSIFAMSLNLLLGYAGQVSVAHASFGAVGGYTVGYLAINEGWNVFLAVLLGAVIAGVVGGIVALPALRLSVEFLILLTLAVSSVLLGVIITFDQLGGTYGLIGIPFASIFGWELDRPSRWIVPLLVLAALTYALCHRLGESAFGRVLKGLRDDDQATLSLGKRVVFYKVVVFAISCGLAGLAGGLLAGLNSLANPSSYGFDVSLSIFAMVIFGGIGNLLGSILGAAAVVLTRPLLEWALDLSPETAGLWRLAVYGLLLVVLMRLRPQGLLPEGVVPWKPSTWRGRRAPGRAEAAHVDQAIAAAASDWEQKVSHVDEREDTRREVAWHDAPVVLEVTGLSKRFGAITAAEDLSFTLRQGTITALVGPNGAGKTTVFNLLTGFIPPDTGSVRLRGRELVGMKPDAVARAGMVRSWQDVRVIPRLSSLQNVMLGVQDQPGERLSRLFVDPVGVRSGERATREKAMEWLGFVGMADMAQVPAGALSFGQSKLVALARVLATDADVLLLDEPASGIDTQWVDAMLDLIEKVREQGRTVCIVEHNLHVVGRLADHTYFMELGRITDQGSLEQLTHSPRLAEAYFGTV